MIKSDHEGAKAGAGVARKILAPMLLYRVLFAVAVLLSIGGIFYGALHIPSSDGGRGGALADMLAFFLLFIRSDFPLDSYRARKYVIPDLHKQMLELMAKIKKVDLPVVDIQEEEQDRKLEGILAMIQAIGQDQRRQNFYIAWASFIGTLSWGFGDIAASYIKNFMHW